MEMDEEMEDTVEEGFMALEIDLDYEFDASQYFDFRRKESPLESREAELWFESAGSYPPSPFIVKLNLKEDILLDNVNTSPKSNDMESTNSITNDSNIGMGEEFSALDENNRGLTFYNHMAQYIPKAKTKSASQASLSRGSTLMKPTASQLAKQNRPWEGFYYGRFPERFQKPLVQNKERSLENPFGTESQAAKRQKLEGGHLCKVADLKQQTTLVHKVPKKDGPVNGNAAHAKLKLTIPRQPDLETARRAQRASVMVFHLKTSQRATQHTSAASSSSLSANKSDKVVHKPNTGSTTQNGFTESKRLEGYEIMKKFKARPLNKKIVSSNLRSSKREVVMPREFNLPTDNSCQPNPPMELFSKELGHPMKVKWTKFVKWCPKIGIRVSALLWRLMDTISLMINIIADSTIQSSSFCLEMRSMEVRIYLGNLCVTGLHRLILMRLFPTKSSISG
ncbi:hypothetical protein HHK36_028774 [Tetracentron sinense]|uniref:TPX2 central domain-containing protein n=1 Tax=Tetracentron sinense TaxID=13715 RepID=A0A834YFM7_TETSI|nr:hypothetical protein HHK36_028774 [Tetracentron sinense]